jgi:hypothetical protein
MHSFSDRFYSVVNTAIAGIAGVSGELYEQGFSKAVRPWLVMQYAAIRATLPLLHFALEHLEARGDEAFTPALRAYYQLKLQDEAEHDSWIAEDLARAGVSEESLNQKLPPAAITAMLGSQYYLIAHHHPALYLGYIGIFESYIPSPDQVRRVIRESGAPEEAFETYKLHTEIDVEHKLSLVKILDAVPDQDGLREAIISNAIRCGEYCCQALEGLLESPRA